jgi:Helix-turn-helix domain
MQDKSSSRILTVNEVRDEYGIPISTQRLWRAEGRFVPWYRAGARIVYRRELIEQWVEEQEQKEQARRLATRTGGDDA